MKRVQQDEFEAWLAHPVTRALREYCTARAEQIALQWRAGAMSGGDATRIALTNVEQSAAAMIFDEIAAMEWGRIQQFYEELRSQEDDDEDEYSDETEAGEPVRH